MLIVDSHLDIAYNALEWDRDLLQPIARIREAEAGMAQKGRGLNVVNFDELRKIPAILEKRGYSQTDVADIMHGNWVRLLSAAWK